MYTWFYTTFALLLVTSLFLSDRQVAGKCGDIGIADTPWAACLVADDGGVCPHNFKKLDDDGACGPPPYNTRTPPWKDRVCCLLGPDFGLSVKDSPCLAGSPESDDVDKTSRKHH